MNPIISVVIPIYQAEESIKNCISKVLQQTYKNFELLLINDGSTDNSAFICDKYAEKYSNIRVFHQKNAGPSAARNKGIEEAIGDFITFIDADDFVDDKFLENFFITSQNPKESLVQQGYIKDYREGKQSFVQFSTMVYSTEDFSELFKKTHFIKTFPFPWAKLYDKNIIISNNIRFRDDIRYGEDLIFILEYVIYVNQIILIEKSAYHYVNNEYSLSASYQDHNNEIQRFLYIKERADIICEKYKFKEEVKRCQYEHMANYLTRAFSTIYTGKWKKSRKERLLIYQNFEPELLKFIRKYYKATNLSKRVFKLLLINQFYIILDAFMQMRAKK